MTYTDADWNADYLAIFAKRTPAPPCPGCGRTGFYGPRRADDDRRYALCKFCGFYQEAGGEPTQCRATVHGCPSWPIVAGASYVWWARPEETEYGCPYCGIMVGVVAVSATRPVDDRSHPWWQVPQHLTFDQAAAFWLEEGEARVYL
jgi:hypothetical protein